MALILLKGPEEFSTQPGRPSLQKVPIGTRGAIFSERRIRRFSQAGISGNLFRENRYLSHRIKNSKLIIQSTNYVPVTALHTTTGRLASTLTVAASSIDPAAGLCRLLNK